MKYVKCKGKGNYYLRPKNIFERWAIKRRLSKSCYFVRWFQVYGYGPKICEVLTASVIYNDFCFLRALNKAMGAYKDVGKLRGGDHGRESCKSN